MSYSSLLRSTFVRYIPNSLILAMLVALGIWGHSHHWRMPRFSELKPGALGKHADGLHGSKSEPVPASSKHAESIEGSDGVVNSRIPTNGSELSLLESRSSLPLIRFRSLESVQNSGILVESAEAKDLDEFVSANGVVEYDETRYAQLASRTPGFAWRVDKKTGDAVRKGEVLAVLDSNEVGKAKAELLEAAVTFHLKYETFRRLERSRSAVAEQMIIESNAAQKLARVRLSNAQQTLINLGIPLPKGWDSEFSVEQGARTIQFLGIPEAIIAEFGPDVVTANLIPLCAPFDGVVIDREIVTGEVVQTGHPQFIIADVSRMWLKLNVRKADAGRLAIGQEIWFSSDGVPGEVKSRISWIATEVDVKTRMVQVRGEVENPRHETAAGAHDGQRLLRAHTFGTARIRVRDERSTVVVPSSAIQADGGRYLVFVPRSDGRSFQPRLVVPGSASGDDLEIVRGVRAGERVVTSGSYVLKAEMWREQAARTVLQTQ